MSQLVQTAESLDVTSAGSIERDQQGQSNKYNYNYWSSPVSPINTTAKPIIQSKVFYMTGQIPHHQQQLMVDGYNGSPGSPINLARYWVYNL
jgi:hypothetical protein